MRDTRMLALALRLFRAHESDATRQGFPSRARWSVVRNRLLMILLVGETLAFLFPRAAAQADIAASPLRTWKTVAELSPEERAAIDFSTETPRHAEFPYLPAEPFPFAPPYTAE